jgi:amino acid adenylation domain-containing protein/thioester reductase-like protein
MGNKESYDKKVVASHHNFESRDFWKEKLSGETYTGNFRYDFNKQIAGEKDRREKVEITFSPKLVSKLLSAAKQSDYALHIILSVGLAVLLDKYSYTTETDKNIIFISPIYKQEKEGEFINTILPLIVPLKGDPSFKTFLQQVKQIVLDAVHHQNYPVELLLQQMNLSPDSDPTGKANDFFLFDSAIFLENIHDIKYIRHIDFKTVFSFARAGDSITGELEYSALLYREQTMRQIARHFSILLEQGLFDPSLELSRLEVLTEAEKEELLDTFSRTSLESAENTADWTLHALFEEQVKKTPGKTAVIYAAGDDVSLTYGELNEKADRLAGILKRKGVKANTIVSLILEPSLEMVVGILGVLKAGGAFLPIEPTDPSERIFYLLNDCGTPLLVTTRDLFEIGVKDLTGKENEYETIILDEVPESVASTGPTVAGDVGEPEIPGNRAAYVIYTSGTTGKPKGVLVDHKGVINYTLWRMKTYGMTPEDITLQLLSYSFDGFGSNFYSSLISGGTLVMFPSSKKMDYGYIKEIVKHKKVTNISLVPPMYEALLSSDTGGELAHLKFVVLGGERAGSHIIRAAEEKIPGIRHIIEYGPTETSIGAAANVGVSPSDTAVIGKPIANTAVYILNPRDKFQPINVPGELCIAGPGVTRGYVNNQNLTAEKFNWPDEFHESYKTDSFYKTGDLARWLPDGNIELLGRIDGQVKIRGFRVELKEIESLLRQLHEIDDCIVVTRDTGSSSDPLELAAYFKAPEDLTSARVREFLAHCLPDYMIPSHLIRLDEFPLTPNGKIDRKMLSLFSDYTDGRETVQPRNIIEQRMVDVWRQVIGTDAVGIANGFFDIGGTSIKAMAVVAQLSKEFDITIDHIYKYGTIEQIAKNVSWEKDNLKKRVEEIRLALIENIPLSPAMIKEREEQIKEMETFYNAYSEQVEKEKPVDLGEDLDYGHILLTGGAGYLGAHLIYEFLGATDARLYVLVKEDTPERAEARLRDRLDYYFEEGFFETHRNRLKVIHGDVRAEKLGIEDSLYEELCSTVDAVVHTAARVSYIGIYEDFYKSNVVGTRNLLELAAEGKKKDFHHISDLGVAGGNVEGKRFLLFTEFSPVTGKEASNAYYKSKLEAETAALAARENGLNVSIYRPSHLTFNSGTGKFHEKISNNAFYTRLKAFVTMGMTPVDWTRVIGMTFADRVAGAIGLIMRKKNLLNRTFHLRNPYTLDWKKMTTLLVKAGVDVKPARLVDFLDGMTAFIDEEKHMELISQILIYSGVLGTSRDRQVTTDVEIASWGTAGLLEQLGFEWPEPDQRHIENMIRHCKQVNYL